MKTPTVKNKISYACGDIYGGGAFLLIGVLYLIFLTDIVGLPAYLAGSIFLIGKIWDAISDPIMGVITDRTKSRFGRRRIYFLIGVLPIFISFAALWYTVESESIVAMYIYYLMAYLFISTTLTMVYIPYSSILPSMTKDYKERTSFITLRLVFSNISAIISGVLPMIIVSMFGTNEKLGYLVMGIGFGLFYALPYLILFSGTYENDYDANIEFPSFKFKELFTELSSVWKNQSFKVYTGIFLSSQTAVDFVVTLFVYYLTYNLGIGEMFPIVLGTMLITQIISMPIHMKIANKYQKITPLKVGLPVWIIALVLSFFISDSNPNLVYVVAVLSGFGCSASIFVPWSIFPDLADVDELITDRRREGTYSGFSTLIRKMSSGLAIFIIGVVLDLVGYVPKVEQTETTLLGIKVMFALVPIIFIILTIFFSKKYKLNEKNYNGVIEEINRRKKESSLLLDSVKIKSLEEVSGQDYTEMTKYILYKSNN